jgi:hypothetical protein
MVNKSIEGGDEPTFHLVEGHKKFNGTFHCLGTFPIILGDRKLDLDE